MSGVGIALCRQRGENVVQIAHDVLSLRLLHSAAATAGLVVGIVVTTATALLLLRRGVVKSQLDQKVVAGFIITTATALRSLVQRVKHVHRGKNVLLHVLGMLLGALLLPAALIAINLATVIALLVLRLAFGGIFLLLGLLRLLFGFFRHDCGVFDGNCGGGLRRTHGDAGRSIAAGTGGLQRCDEFGLAHGGSTAKSHLLCELLELRQFHIFKIRAGCHLLCLSLALPAHACNGLKKRIGKSAR